MNIRRPVCLLCILFVIITYCVLQLNGGVDEAEYNDDYKSVILQGKITDKLVKNGNNLLHIMGFCDGDSNGKKYIVYLDEQSVDDFKIGQQVVVKGSYRNFSLAENDGQFDSRKYYRIRGYAAMVKKARVSAAGEKYNEFREFLYRKKEKSKSVYFENMSETEAGTLSAMVLGDKTDMDEEVKSAYQNAGISHVLSLSGLHIATVGMCLFSMLLKTGIGIKAASLISSACMLSYGIMTGMSTSTQRALVMFLLAIIAKNLGRTYDLLSSAALSAILLLVESPYYIYDSGFLMSFMAVEGIGLLYPVINEITEIELDYNANKYEERRFLGISIAKILKFLEKTLEGIRQGICISMAASLATLPIVMNCFYKTSRYGIFVNIIVVPLMTIVLWAGIIAGLSPKGMAGGLLASPLLFTDEKILKLFSLISDKVKNLPGNIWVTGKSSGLQIVVYFVIMLAVCGLHKYMQSQVFQLQSQAAQMQGQVVQLQNQVVSRKKSRKQDVKIVKKGTNRIAIAFLFCLAVLILSYRKKPELSVNVLSVGQGACNVIYGQGIPTILIDGGSSDVKEVGKYRIKPFLLSKGIGGIDYLFISHPDADHINGIRELMEDGGLEIKIKHVFMSVRDSEIEDMADNLGAKFYMMSEGDRVENGEIRISCISPENAMDPEKNANQNVTDGNETSGNKTGGSKTESESINDSSLVLLLDYRNEFKCLFPGDISSEVEAEILSSQKKDGKDKDGKNPYGNTEWPRLSDVNMLSVAHHGSKYSSSQAFIEYLSPDICTISSGEGNSYGHPHGETIERLLKYLPENRIYRTDKSGQITLTYGGGKIGVSRFRE